MEMLLLPSLLCICSTLQGLLLPCSESLKVFGAKLVLSTWRQIANMIQFLVDSYKPILAIPEIPSKVFVDDQNLRRNTEKAVGIFFSIIALRFSVILYLI